MAWKSLLFTTFCVVALLLLPAESWGRGFGGGGRVPVAEASVAEASVAEADPAWGVLEAEQGDKVWGASVEEPAAVQAASVVAPAEQGLEPAGQFAAPTDSPVAVRDKAQAVWVDSALLEQLAAERAVPGWADHDPPAQRVGSPGRVAIDTRPPAAGSSIVFLACRPIRD